jgi:branched-chain amino acid transport system substrate-binding protein
MGTTKSAQQKWKGNRKPTSLESLSFTRIGDFNDDARTLAGQMGGSLNDQSFLLTGVCLAKKIVRKRFQNRIQHSPEGCRRREVPMLRRFLGMSVLVAAGALSISISRAQSDQPILIGVHLDQAKQASYYSLLQKGAIDLFVTETNSAGGVLGRQIKVLYEDDENNPVTTVTKVDKLASENVSYIVSIGSSATGAATQTRASELKIPHGAPANLAESLTTDPPNPYYFRIPLRGKYEVQAVAQYLKKKFGSPKLAMVRDSTQTGLVISDQWLADLKKAGFEFVAVEQITPGSTEATGQALRVKESKADVVIVCGASIPDLVNYIKAHKLFGNPAPMIGSSVFTVGGFLKLAGPTAEGFVYPDAVDPSRPEIQAIEKKFAAANGDQMKNQAVSLQAYEYMRLIVDAIKRAGSDDRQKIRDAMEATKDWPIAIGPAGTKLTYSPANHDLFTSADQVVLREVKNGEFGPALQWR